VVLLAAGLSLVAKRRVRWSAIWLAIMFALFVLAAAFARCCDPPDGGNPLDRCYPGVCIRDSSLVLVRTSSEWCKAALDMEGIDARKYHITKGRIVGLEVLSHPYSFTVAVW